MSIFDISYRNYLCLTMNLADQFPKLLNDVILDNKNLVLEHILPFPPKLYEQLLGAVVGDADEGYQMFWQQPSCVKLAYEGKVWAEVNSFENYSYDKLKSDDDLVNAVDKGKYEPVTRFQLRNLRNSIYVRIRYGQSVDSHIWKYNSLTEDFIHRSENELTEDDVAILKDRVKRTENAAPISKIKNTTNHQSINLTIKINLL